MLGGRAARNRYLEEHDLRWAKSIFHLSIIEHVCSGSLDLLFLLPVLLVDEVVRGRWKGSDGEGPMERDGETSTVSSAR